MSLFHTLLLFFFFFFFNDTATTEIYTLSLHDALPISAAELEFAHLAQPELPRPAPGYPNRARCRRRGADRKSTRLNSSHGYISYAVFCLKKKKKIKIKQNNAQNTTEHKRITSTRSSHT